MTETRIPTPVSRLTKSYGNQGTDGTHMVDLADMANLQIIARCIYEPYANEILHALDYYFRNCPENERYRNSWERS